MRKEYNNRHNAPLVNPGFTIGEYEASRSSAYDLGAVFSTEDAETIKEFESMLNVRQAAHFAKIQERSAK